MNLKLDPATHDVVRTKGQLVTVTGTDETAQRLRTRLKTFLGEWFLDPTTGLIDFVDWLGKKAPDFAKLRAAATKVIVETPGVASLASLTFDLPAATRILTVRYVAVADTGQQLAGAVVL